MTRNKVVIYTAIAGGGDNLIQHKYKSPDFDYICFSDRPMQASGIWEVRQMPESYLDDVRKAKYYKLFPHELFSEYLYSVWVDGNIDILDDSLERRVYNLIETDVLMAANIHPYRKCAYEEANACIVMGKDSPEAIMRQVDFMKSNGFPREQGLYALMVIFRKHHDSEVEKLMDRWWWMIKKFSRRDQISFMYVLYESNMKIDVLFEQDIYSDPAFSFKRHSVSFFSKLAIDTGDGFNYKNMSVKRFTTNEKSKIEMEFYLDGVTAVKRARFYPFDTGVGSVKLENISFQDVEGRNCQVNLKKVISNGTLRLDGSFAFKNFLPVVDIPVSGQIQKIIISGIFKVENEATSKQIISAELEKGRLSLLRRFGNLVLNSLRRFEFIRKKLDNQ